MWDDGVGNVHHWLSDSAPRRRGTCLPARDNLITATSRSQRNPEGGCILDLGREQSGGELAPAVAGTVYRLWARRIAGARPGRTEESVSWGGCEFGHKAGTYGDLMGLAGRGLAGHLRLGTCHQYRHPVDEAVGGALRGRSPRTREGRIGPTAQNGSGQWLVVSDGAPAESELIAD